MDFVWATPSLKDGVTFTLLVLLSSHRDLVASPPVPRSSEIGCVLRQLLYVRVGS